jgi:YD repeat-containing protein
VLSSGGDVGPQNSFYPRPHQTRTTLTSDYGYADGVNAPVMVPVSNGNAVKTETTALVDGVSKTNTTWYTYTNAGAGYVASVRETNGNLTEYGRDSMGRITSIKRYNGSVLESSESFTRTEHLITAHFKTTYTNGVGKTRYINYSYTPEGQMASKNTTGASPSVYESWTYESLPGSGEKVLKTHTYPDGSVETYNRADRLYRP